MPANCYSAQEMYSLVYIAENTRKRSANECMKYPLLIAIVNLRPREEREVVEWKCWSPFVNNPCRARTHVALIVLHLSKWVFRLFSVRPKKKIRSFWARKMLNESTRKQPLLSANASLYWLYFILVNEYSGFFWSSHKQESYKKLSFFYLMIAA